MLSTGDPEPVGAYVPDTLFVFFTLCQRGLNGARAGAGIDSEESHFGFVEGSLLPGVAVEASEVAEVFLNDTLNFFVCIGGGFDSEFGCEGSEYLLSGNAGGWFDRLGELDDVSFEAASCPGGFEVC